MSIERAEIDLAKTRADIDRMASQLRTAESRAIKLAHYIEMARAYEATLDDGDAARARAAGSPLITATVELLKERGTRIPTRVLVEELDRRGLQIGGSNKITNLSGTLSRSPLLCASRVEGWGLKEWETAAVALDQSMPPSTAVSLTPERIEAERVVPPPPPPVPALRIPPPPPAPASRVQPIPPPPRSGVPSWEPAGGDLDDEIPF